MNTPWSTAVVPTNPYTVQLGDTVQLPDRGGVMSVWGIEQDHGRLTLHGTVLGVCTRKRVAVTAPDVYRLRPVVPCDDE